VIESHTSDDFMTKFYIGLADSASVGVSFPAQQTRAEAGVGCLAFVSGDHGWSLALLRDLFLPYLTASRTCVT
jgi:hypothetical protein